MHALVLLNVVLSTLAAEPIPAPEQPPAAPTVSAPSTPEPAASARELPDRVHLLETKRQELRESNAAVRIIRESLVGATLSVGGLLAWGLVTGSQGSDLDVLMVPLILTLGSSAGVALMGSSDVQGNFGNAWVGSLVGFALPFGLAMGVCLTGSDGCSAVLPFAVVGMLVLPTVGAIIGFENSAPATAPALKHEESTANHQMARRILVPVLAPTSQGIGAIVGIAGTL